MMIQTAQNTSASFQNANARPREIGVLDRVNGVRASTFNLVEQLEAFADRLNAEGAKPVQTVAQAAAPGLVPCITDTEGNLRRAFEIISKLNELF